MITKHKFSLRHYNRRRPLPPGSGAQNYRCAQNRHLHARFSHEDALLARKLCAHLRGVDEAGRGPLAGPVVAGAALVAARRGCSLASANSTIPKN